jgi:hypothetical protein
MILAALDVEVEEYLARHRSARDEQGHAVVVSNGRARPRRVTVVSAPMIEVPRTPK